jgi:hypothetical protein
MLQFAEIAPISIASLDGDEDEQISMSDVHSELDSIRRQHDIKGVFGVKKVLRKYAFELPEGSSLGVGRQSRFCVIQDQFESLQAAHVRHSPQEEDHGPMLAGNQRLYSENCRSGKCTATSTPSLANYRIWQSSWCRLEVMAKISWLFAS